MPNDARGVHIQFANANIKMRWLNRMSSKVRFRRHTSLSTSSDRKKELEKFSFAHVVRSIGLKSFKSCTIVSNFSIN